MYYDRSYKYPDIELMPEHPQSECRQCGTCCQKSSPTLHPEDLELFRKGTLTHADVYTLRKGEFAYDNISGQILCLDRELVKLKERPATRICKYLDGDGSDCAIYDLRPLQCRTLECWNPEPLIELFGSAKIDRMDLIQDPQARELVLHHEERTSFGRLAGCFRALASGGPEEPILDILNFDLYIRNFVVERSALESETLPFYFGRPMIECLSGFGYRLEGDRDQGFVLSASG